MRGSLHALWLVLAACTGPTAPSPPEPPPRPDLLLVTFDTTRADALGAWGADPSPSPTWDGLAAGGLRASDAMTVAPLTLPAHTSILSGIYPDVHRVRDNGQPVPAGLPLVSEALDQAGYQTGAVVAAVVLDGALGLDRGFDTYVDGFDLSRLEGVHQAGATRTADEVVDAALSWLDQAEADAPVFLWVHVYDPHHPLLPPAAFARRHDDPYAAEIAFADAEVGRVVEAVRARGRDHRIVMVADHGEGRGDHGEASHGQFVYRSTMHVPLVVAGTGVEPGVIDSPTSVVDVAPTLLAAAHLPVPDGLDGLDLLGALPEERVVYGESYHQRRALGLAALHVWQDESQRYIEAPRSEVYDHVADPDESRDRATDHADELAAWERRAAAWRAGRPEPLDEAETSLDPATAEALQSLGYLPGVDPEPDAVLPDPKDHPGLQARVDALVVLARTRPPAEAVPLLREFVDAHPRVLAARNLLVRALQLSGQADAALEAIAPLLAQAPDDIGLNAQAAELHLQAGRVATAREHLRRARAVEADNPTVAGLSGEIARREGRCAAVLPELDRVLAVHPEASRTRLVRGTCRRDVGRSAEAAEDLARVLEEDPSNGDVRFVLALTRLDLGEPARAEPLLVEQLALTPDAPLAHGALGLARLRQGRVDEALEPLTRAARDEASGVEGPLTLAEALLALDGDDAAITRWIDTAASRGDGDPRVLRVRASHLMHLGRTAEALEVMVRAREAQEALLRSGR